jgi:hypothetical protein
MINKPRLLQEVCVAHHYNTQAFAQDQFDEHQNSLLVVHMSTEISELNTKIKKCIFKADRLILEDKFIKLQNALDNLKTLDSKLPEHDMDGDGLWDLVDKLKSPRP